MKKYIFYNKNGEIVHTHRVYKAGSEKLVHVKEKELKKMVQRILNYQKMKFTISDIPTRSSSILSLKMNLKTKKVISSKLPRDYWKKKSEESLKKIKEDLK